MSSIGTTRACVVQEFEKLASRKLRLNAKEAMGVAEKLYTKGYISYPRTETNIFPKELNLVNLVEMQAESRHWGGNHLLLAVGKVKNFNGWTGK